MPPPSLSQSRGLARSSPWRWRALAFALRRRPLGWPEERLAGRLVRGVGLTEVWPDGMEEFQASEPETYLSFSAGATRSDAFITRWKLYGWQVPVDRDADGFVVRRPLAWMAEDPMWQDYQFVALLDPVELADGESVDPGDDDADPPPALDLHRTDATVRAGRETWWAEVTPRPEYVPRCGCCPLLFGRVSEDLEARAGGPRVLDREPDLVYATSYLVGLDVQTGICVHVEHLDGSHVGSGFSLDVLGVDDDVAPVGPS